MLIKFSVITLSLVFVPQVLSVEASDHGLDCGSLCEQVDSGLAGLCCGKAKHKTRQSILGSNVMMIGLLSECSLSAF